MYNWEKRKEKERKNKIGMNERGLGRFEVMFYEFHRLVVGKK